MTLNNQQAQDKHRYYFCIASEKDHINHGTFVEHTGIVTGCSNGVTLDLEPPEPGTVYVGMSGFESFQVRIRGALAVMLPAFVTQSNFS